MRAGAARRPVGLRPEPAGNAECKPPGRRGEGCYGAEPDPIPKPRCELAPHPPYVPAHIRVARRCMAGPLSPWALSRLTRQIYAGGPPLTLHQTLTTVYRPLYAPFDQVLPWIPRGARLLDIGCGGGALMFLAHAVQGLESGYGIDTQPGSIVLARTVNHDPRLSFVCSSEVPPDIIAKCTVICLIDVLHHMPRSERDAVLHRYLDGATAGTVVIIKDLDPRPRWRAWCNRVTDYLSTRSRVDYLAMDTVVTMLRRTGFDILEAVRLHRHIWSHYLVVGRRAG